jgi:hypothetical protein
MALFQQAIKLRAQFDNADFLVRHGIHIMLGAFAGLKQVPALRIAYKIHLQAAGVAGAQIGEINRPGHSWTVA